MLKEKTPPLPQYFLVGFILTLKFELVVPDVKKPVHIGSHIYICL